MKNFLKIIAGTFIGSLLAIILGTFILFGIIGSLVTMAEVTPTVPTSAVLSLDFTTPITEQKSEDISYSMSADITMNKTTGILELVQTIDMAAEDPAIKFIYMNLTEIEAGITHIEEIRSALERFRLSGKPIIAYADDYSQGAYYLASAADKIFLNPSGSSTLTGVSTTTIFFKDLLDRLGVEVQLIRHGKFKAAAEQLISNKMSPENREQLKAYGDAVWTTWSEAISKSRSIDIASLNKMTDDISVTNSKKALELKLVDGLLYKDQLIDTIAHLFGVEKEAQIKMINNTSYYSASKKSNYREKEKIAVIYAEGDIISGKSDENVASDNFVKLLSDVRKDSSIKAIVLRVNSPGGDARSAEMIDRELTLLKEKKPIIVSMGDYAASGGYWIAAKANKIYTNNTTLTGSIGVFSMAVNFGKTMNSLLKINAESVNTNKHSDMLSGYRSLNNEEVIFLQSSVEDIYTSFLELVATGRSMSSQEVDSIAQGRIWAGRDAVKIGLADEIGGLNEAIKGAASIANLQTYKLVEYPIKKSQIDKIIEQFTMVKASTGIGSLPELFFYKAYSSLINERGVKTMARLPFNVEVNK